MLHSREFLNAVAIAFSREENTNTGNGLPCFKRNFGAPSRILLKLGTYETSLLKTNASRIVGNICRIFIHRMQQCLNVPKPWAKEIILMRNSRPNQLKVTADRLAPERPILMQGTQKIAQNSFHITLNTDAIRNLNTDAVIRQQAPDSLVKC